MGRRSNRTRAAAIRSGYSSAKPVPACHCCSTSGSTPRIKPRTASTRRLQRPQKRPLPIPATIRIKRLTEINSQLLDRINETESKARLLRCLVEDYLSYPKVAFMAYLGLKPSST